VNGVVMRRRTVYECSSRVVRLVVWFGGLQLQNMYLSVLEDVVVWALFHIEHNLEGT
jgi:hypothetical protein